MKTISSNKFKKKALNPLLPLQPLNKNLNTIQATRQTAVTILKFLLPLRISAGLTSEGERERERLLCFFFTSVKDYVTVVIYKQY